MKALRQFLIDLTKKRLHVSWPITAGCLGLVAGVSLSLWVDSPLPAGGWWLLCGLVLFTFAIISRLRIMIVAAIIAGLMIGLWRGTLARVDLSTYQHYLGQPVRLIGTVNSDPDLESNAVKLQLTNIEVILQSDYDQLSDSTDIDNYFEVLPGHIWASVFTSARDIKRSDRVTISGTLKPGFGSFAATISYGQLEHVERSIGADPFRELRDSFGDQLRSVIPVPAADLGMGVLAGQKSALPADLAQAFIIASLTHIVVASGYNLTILIRFARRLFAKISRLIALLFGSGLAIAFAAMVGFSPSMVRASLVAGLSLLAWYYGRRFHPITLLAVVAAITVLANPASIWGDVGWYLSFLSFVGVIILAPLVNAYFFADQSEKSGAGANIRQVFIETLSAQVVAAPVIALFMGQFSVYGLLANLLVLPLLPLVMLLTFAAGLAAWLLPAAVATVVAWPATQLLDYVVGIANWVSDLPGAQHHVDVSLLGCVTMYVLLLGVIFYLRAKTRYDLRASNVVE